MFDLITYSKDTKALLVEAPESLLRKDDDGVSVGLNITKTSTVRNGDETLSVVRCDAATLVLLKGLTNLKVLAEVEAYGDLLAAMNLTNKKIYDRVHDQTPYDDGEGNMITPSALIGEFF